MRGSYIDEGVFKIEKDYENLRFSRVLTNYVFDEGSPLARSKGANISDSTFQVFSIKGENEEGNEYLIDITSMLLSEALTPIKPIFSQDDYQNSGFSWGQISPSKSRIIDVYNYEENTQTTLQTNAIK